MFGIKKKINVFEKGVLVQINTRVWTGRVKTPASIVDETADADFISVHKNLIDKENLRNIEHVRNLARSWVQNRTLPFPLTGVLFIPKDMISQVDEKMKEYQEKFYEEVEDFVDKYDLFVRQAKDSLGSLYDPTEYPTDIETRFGFDWNFFVMSTPDKAGMLSPELYESEKEKFHNTMHEFELIARATLRKSFSEIVERLAERTNGAKKKTFRDTAVSNITEFINDFKAMDITNDKELKKLTEAAQQILGNTTAEELRNDDDLRTNISADMKEIAARVAGLEHPWPRE